MKPFQLSLRGLALAMMIVAGFLACAAAVGADNWIFWIAFLICFAFSLVYSSWASSTSPRRFALGSPLLLLVLAFLMAPLIASPAIFLTAVLHTLVPLVCKDRRFFKVLFASTLCTLICFVTCSFFGRSEAARYRNLRETHPFEPLAERLAYEPSNPNVTPVALSPEFLQLKDAHLMDGFGSLRESGLWRLHQRTFEKFSRAQGFGVTRMSHFRAHFIELAPLRTLQLGELDAEPHESAATRRRQILSAPQIGSIDDVHWSSVFDFLDAIDFGIVTTIDGQKQVAGFVPHAFHHPIPTLSTPTQTDSLTLTQLQLVSTRRFDRPMAYDIQHLPRMDELSSIDAPTRELTEIEGQLLAKLKSGQDVAIHIDHEPPTMVGAIRAVEKCLDCHAGAEGSMLGALAYSFARTPIAE